MSRCVLFDLDGTLTDRHASITSYVRQLAEDLARSLTAEELADLTERAIALDGNGYTKHLLETLAQLDVWRVRDLEGVQVLDHWDRHFPRHAAFAPGARELLSRLGAAGVSLGLVTNGKSRVQREKLRALDVEDRFAAIVISEEAGIAKPDRAIFERACDALGVPVARCVFVGDHPVNDVQGARDAGLAAVWFSSGPAPTSADGSTAPLRGFGALEDVVSGWLTSGELRIPSLP